MSKPNAVDRHPDKEAIYRDIALGVPLRKIAGKYGLKLDSVFRAKKRLPEDLRRAVLNAAIAPSVAEAEAMRTTEERALVPTLQVQRVRMLLLQDLAVEKGNLGLAASISGHIIKNVEATARITGALAPTKTVSVNITTSPEYLSFRLAVMRALEAFPAARDAVLRIIRDSEKPHQEAVQAIAGPAC
jgi:hypothetical protein